VITESSGTVKLPRWKLPTFVVAPQVTGIGSSGPDILDLERRLAAMHYDLGAVDGIYDYSTEHAVIAFQKLNGLARTGIYDAATRAAIDHPFIPTARVGGATHVEVDLSSQVVYYVSGGAIARILDASTGGGYTFYVDGVQHLAVTPIGTFTIFQRIPGWWESQVGPMYDSNFFLPTFALHGETSVPTYPASHGCVRVTVPAMDRLWRLLSIGMTITIYA